MTASDPSLTRSTPTFIPSILSLFIPGAGQFFLKHRWRGFLIFLAVILLGLLVGWSLSNQQIGQVVIGGWITSWLWLPLLLFWIWNVVDARQMAAGKNTNGMPAILFSALILYVIAWNVTDIKPDRLISRFADIKQITSDLINPDFFTQTIDGQPHVCSWGCLWNYSRDRLAGRTPQDTVAISDNIGDIFGRTKLGPAPSWRVNLGLAAKDSRVSIFVPGKLMETIAIGLMATLFSTLLAIPLSFLAAHNVMSRVPGGTIIYYGMRGILNIVRAIDTVVWGLIVIVWVGLGTFAGVIALTIHSVAALGKLFSEEIEHIDSGPIEAVTATGANLFQVVRYAIIPQVVPPFLAYTLLRWDINMRSATIIGVVAGGGVGFLVLQYIRQGGYQQYAAILWAVAIVIILVDYISGRWRNNILQDQPAEPNQKTRPVFSNLRKLFYIVLGIAVFLYCWNITEINLTDLFSPGKTFGRLILDFINIDVTPVVLNTVITQMIVTIFQAFLATTLGAIIAVPFSFLAARNLTGRSRLSIWLYYLARSILNVLRSIEALLYVAIFVFWVGIGAFSGMMALAITSFALLGKLFSEAIENIDPGPIEAITATGANRIQMIGYAILPQIVPPFVSYLIYQWDINVRMATIIGFAGGGGIGLTLSTFFGSLQYHKAGTVVACIVLVVALMDFASAKLREKLI